MVRGGTCWCWLVLVGVGGVGGCRWCSLLVVGCWFVRSLVSVIVVGFLVVLVSKLDLEKFQLGCDARSACASLASHYAVGLRGACTQFRRCMRVASLPACAGLSAFHTAAYVAPSSFSFCLSLCIHSSRQLCLLACFMFCPFVRLDLPFSLHCNGFLGAVRFAFACAFCFALWRRALYL